MKFFNTLKTTLTDTGVLQIHLNRPDKLNALSGELLSELHEIILHAQTNTSIKALLLTGEGNKAFCAGADISGLANITAQAILHTILAMAPLAIRSVMQVIDVGYDLTLEAALHLEATHFALVCATADKKIGVNAFLQKTKPTFTNQ